MYLIDERMYNILLDKNVHFKGCQNKELYNTNENKTLNTFDIYNAPQIYNAP